MPIDWSVVTAQHVQEACELFDSGARVPNRPARTTFYEVGPKRYPAKFIRGLAYELATGVRLDPTHDFSGGEETTWFFEKLKSPDPIDPVPPPPQRFTDPQKQSLYACLLAHFGNEIEMEKKFDWLTAPNPAGIDEHLRKVYDAIQSLRGMKGFGKVGHRLACDFYIPSRRMLIEYDERQHFTVQRGSVLRAMSRPITARFDCDEWITHCDRIRASDLTPPNRDETRAWYDSLRDILAQRNGMKLVRIRQHACDWCDPIVAKRHLDALLDFPSKETMGRIALISRDYNVRNEAGRWDCSDHVQAINRACDAHGCDTAVYSLYTWDSRSSARLSAAHLFDGCSHLRRAFLERGELCDDVNYSALSVEQWQRGSEPRQFRQQFASSGQIKTNVGHAFIASLKERLIDDALLMICGETNIYSTGRWKDWANVRSAMDELKVKVILNPIHDYMRRYEMRMKRAYLSEGGRIMLSVWNQGKGRESATPWTAYFDGRDVTHAIVEIDPPIKSRPDIRIGIADLGKINSA